jgi:hypothetical protein
MKKEGIIIIIVVVIVLLCLCSVVAVPLGLFVFRAKPIVIPPSYDPEITIDDPSVVIDPCDFPNGDVEYWWYTAEEDMRDCYESIYGTPEFLSEPTVNEFETNYAPNEFVYEYLKNDLASQYDDFTTSFFTIEDNTIEAEFIMDGEFLTLWIITSTQDENSAKVLVGPPNAGAVVYNLTRINGLWEVSEILDEGL